MTKRFWTTSSDNNQGEILAQARSVPGLSAWATHRLGSGFPDIAIAYKGFTALVEIKNPETCTGDPEDNLTEDEIKFKNDWAGCYIICYTVDPIIEWVNRINEFLTDSEQPF